MKALKAVPKTLIIVSKPSQVTLFLPAVEAAFPGHDIAFVSLMAGLYKFDWPRGRAYADYPVVETPKWKAGSPFTGFNANPNIYVSSTALGKEASRSPERVLSLLTGADQIIYAADPGDGDAYSFTVLMREVMSIDLETTPLTSCLIYSMWPSAIAAAFANPGSTADAEFVALRRYGETRKFFEYNYNLNAQVFFSRALSGVGIEESRLGVSSISALSRWTLQLLYAYRRGEIPVGMANAYRLLQAWTGTGKYPVRAMASPLSTATIVENLHRTGLIENAGITPLGERLLAQLHPGCEDADLPARLDAWCQDWPASRDAMTRYLKTYFGRQKRFLEKH